MENKASVKITGDSSSLNAATNQADKGLEKLGVTAKQTAAAMRGVPAQFTDIITSLQGGQAPITVLFQQGGQLKDMFGGVGNAARALGGYVLGLINPFTLTAAAAGTLGAAFFYGSEQSKRLENALIISGNVAGQTSGQLETLAETLGETTGHYTQSREAIEALASSGVISGKSLESALKGVLSLSELTGQSVDNLVPKFEEIARDPVKAIVKLNEQYNFLTLDIYKQIKALDEQGKKTEAAQLATETFANALEGRKDQVLDNIGSFERAWRGVKSAIDGAKEAFLGIGRDETLDERLAKAQQQLSGLEASRANASSSSPKDILDSLDAKIAAQKAVVDELARQNNTAKFLAADAAKALQAEKDKIAKAEEDSRKKDKKSPLESEQKKLSELQQENALLAQGIPLQDAQTIAKLKAAGATDEFIVKMLNANNAQDTYIKAIKAADDAEKLRIKTLKEVGEAFDEAYAKGLENSAEAEAELFDAQQKLEAEKAKNAEDISNKLLDDQESLNASLLATDTARAKRQAELAYERRDAEIIANTEIGESQDALLEQSRKNYELELKSIDKKTKETKDLGAELGLTFASTFEDSIVKGETLGDLINSLGQDIERVITRMLIIEPLIKSIKDAMNEAGGADGVFAKILGAIGIGSDAGGDSGSDSSTSTGQSYVDGIPVGDVFSALGYHSGGIAGLNPTFKRGVNSSLFNNAPRFHTGGVAGDEVPAILRKGEGVFTQEQMRNLSPAGGGNVQVNLIEAPNSAKAGSVETSQDGNNKTLNIFIEKIKASIANDISRGTGISSALEQTYALNRAAGAR